MESLAYLVVLLMALLFLTGPFAYILTFLPLKNKKIKIIKRVFQAPFVLVSILISIFIAFTPIPLIFHLVAYFMLALCYLTLRREYLPNFYLKKFITKKFKNNL